MRLDRLSSEILRLLGNESTEVKSKRGQSRTPAVQKDILVTISEEIRSEVELEAPSKERVEEIKKAIAEGRYRIDVHKLSEAILKDILGE